MKKILLTILIIISSQIPLYKTQFEYSSQGIIENSYTTNSSIYTYIENNQLIKYDTQNNTLNFSWKHKIKGKILTHYSNNLYILHDNTLLIHNQQTFQQTQKIQLNFSTNINNNNTIQNNNNNFNFQNLSPHLFFYTNQEILQITLPSHTIQSYTIYKSNPQNIQLNLLSLLNQQNNQQLALLQQKQSFSAICSLENNTEQIEQKTQHQYYIYDIQEENYSLPSIKSFISKNGFIQLSYKGLLFFSFQNSIFQKYLQEIPIHYSQITNFVSFPSSKLFLIEFVYDHIYKYQKIFSFELDLNQQNNTEQQQQNNTDNNQILIQEQKSIQVFSQYSQQTFLPIDDDKLLIITVKNHNNIFAQLYDSSEDYLYIIGRYKNQDLQFLPFTEHQISYNKQEKLLKIFLLDEDNNPYLISLYNRQSQLLDSYRQDLKQILSSYNYPSSHPYYQNKNNKKFNNKNNNKYSHKSNDQKEQEFQNLYHTYIQNNSLQAYPFFQKHFQNQSIKSFQYLTFLKEIYLVSQLRFKVFFQDLKSFLQQILDTFLDIFLLPQHEYLQNKWKNPDQNPILQYFNSKQKILEKLHHYKSSFYPKQEPQQQNYEQYTIAYSSNHKIVAFSSQKQENDNILFTIDPFKKIKQQNLYLPRSQQLQTDSLTFHSLHKILLPQDKYTLFTLVYEQPITKITQQKTLINKNQEDGELYIDLDGEQLLQYRIENIQQTSYSYLFFNLDPYTESFKFMGSSSDHPKKLSTIQTINKDTLLLISQDNQEPQQYLQITPQDILILDPQQQQQQQKQFKTFHPQTLLQTTYFTNQGHIASHNFLLPNNHIQIHYLLQQNNNQQQQHQLLQQSDFHLDTPYLRSPYLENNISVLLAKNLQKNSLYLYLISQNTIQPKIIKYFQLKDKNINYLKPIYIQYQKNHIYLLYHNHSSYQLHHIEYLLDLNFSYKDLFQQSIINIKNFFQQIFQSKPKQLSDIEQKILDFNTDLQSLSPHIKFLENTYTLPFQQIQNFHLLTSKQSLFQSLIIRSDLHLYKIPLNILKPHKIHGFFSYKNIYLYQYFFENQQYQNQDKILQEQDFSLIHQIDKTNQNSSYNNLKISYTDSEAIYYITLYNPDILTLKIEEKSNKNSSRYLDIYDNSINIKIYDIEIDSVYLIKYASVLIVLAIITFKLLIIYQKL